MVIREMNFSDAESVRKIADDTWRDTYTAFIPEEIQDKVLNDAHSNEEMERRFNSALNLVAESDGVMMGYAFYSGDQHLFLESLKKYFSWEDTGNFGVELLDTVRK